MKPHAVGGSVAMLALAVMHASGCGGDAFSSAKGGEPDATSPDGSVNSDADADAGADGGEADAHPVEPDDAGAGGADAPPADTSCGVCEKGQTQTCTPACGQWPGSQTCKADCSGFGACQTDAFAWTAHEADHIGFQHECAGAQDQYGNWQTNYVGNPNNCLAQYGPYLPVPRGAYEASVDVWGDGDSVNVFVANHSGGNTLQTSGPQVITHGWNTIKVPNFRIDDDVCTGVEFKVQWISVGPSKVAIVVGPSRLSRTGP